MENVRISKTEIPIEPFPLNLPFRGGRADRKSYHKNTKGIDDHAKGRIDVMRDDTRDLYTFWFIIRDSRVKCIYYDSGRYSNNNNDSNNNNNMI